MRGDKLRCAIRGRAAKRLDGRTEPDQPARAYLTVIARDPKGVQKSLGTKNA